MARARIQRRQEQLKPRRKPRSPPTNRSPRSRSHRKQNWLRRPLLLRKTNRQLLILISQRPQAASPQGRPQMQNPPNRRQNGRRQPQSQRRSRQRNLRNGRQSPLPAGRALLRKS